MSEVISSEQLFADIRQQIIDAVPEQCRDCNMVGYIATNSASNVLMGNTDKETAVSEISDKVRQNCKTPAARRLGSVSLGDCNIFKHISYDTFKSWY